LAVSAGVPRCGVVPPGLLLGGLVELGDLRPVDDVPEVLHVLGAPVLVLEVVGVLPDVEGEDRNVALRQRRVLVGQVVDGQLLLRVDDEPSPARAELTDRRGENFSLSWSKPPNAAPTASASEPVGAPPAFGPITSQNRLWLAKPPPWLRTTPRIASGTSPRTPRISPTGLPSNGVPVTALTKLSR